MYSGTSILAFHICLYAARTAAFSGELGAYDLTGSFTAFGTLKNPFNIVIELNNFSQKYKGLFEKRIIMI
jgi:hypothetical protein